MKRLLAVLLAFALPVAADGPVVCSETPQSPGVVCSGIATSSAECACVAAEAAAPEPSVYADAVSLWKLDEASGTRADSIGSNDLTDNNTVGSDTPGDTPANLPTTVASFVASNTEYLSIASEFPDSGDTDFTFAVWVKPTSMTLRVIVNAGGAGGGAGRWQLYRNNGNTLTAGVDGSGDTGGSATIDGSAWKLITWVYTKDDNTAKVYVDNVLDITAVGTGSGPFTASSSMNIGAQIGTGFPYDGLMSTAAFWSKALSEDERAALYNSGDGAPLP